MSAVLKSVEGHKVPADVQLLGRLCDLFSGARTGNMGPDLYRNGGANKFEEILKGNGDYTPFKGEVDLLQEKGMFISQWASALETAIIVGPGPGRSVQAKELQILEKMPNLKRVISLELSPTFNKQSAAVLRAALTGVDVHPFEIDFREADLSRIENSKPALVISTGSFTNYEDCQTHSFPQGKVSKHLSKLAELAGQGGKILWGYNSGLNAEQYNHPIVEDFLMYPLVKASAMEGVILDPTAFRHETMAYTAASTLTHYWIATGEQDIVINGNRFPVNMDEQFPMFFSVAQSPKRLGRLLEGSGQTALGHIKSAFYNEGSSGAVLHGFDCN